jgi:hypothetical protein
MFLGESSKSGASDYTQRENPLDAITSLTTLVLPASPSATLDSTAREIRHECVLLAIDHLRLRWYGALAPIQHGLSRRRQQEVIEAAKWMTFRRPDALVVLGDNQGRRTYLTEILSEIGKHSGVPIHYVNELSTYMGQDDPKALPSLHNLIEKGRLGLSLLHRIQEVNRLRFPSPAADPVRALPATTTPVYRTAAAVSTIVRSAERTLVVGEWTLLAAISTALRSLCHAHRSGQRQDASEAIV